MGSPRRAWKFALAAFMAAFVPGALGAQHAPIDPVSGLQIPLLPGQFLQRTKNGCGVIGDLGWQDPDFSRYRWVGACKYGVVDGPGVLVDEAPAEGVYPYWTRQADLGSFRSTSLDYTLFIPRSSNRPAWEKLAIYERSPEGESMQTAGSAITLPRCLGGTRLAYCTTFFLEYETNTGAEHIKEQVWFFLYSCAPYWEKASDYKGYYRDHPTDNFSPQDIDKIATYCQGASRRLKREGWSSFDDVTYGHVHFVSLVKSTAKLGPDGLTPPVESRSPKLCPDLASLVGCEPLWQELLAPYLARFAELKPQEAALQAAAVADTQQRFASLRAAWRARANQVGSGAVVN